MRPAASSAAIAALIVAIIWFPFGFSMGGLIEEWGLISTIDTHPGFWNSFPGHPMADMFVARPLQITPFWLAHFLSPDSFLGFHILLIAACFIRIFSGIAIGRFIFGNSIYAVLLGVLAFVFPADTQQLAFRTLNISCSLALSLAGAAAMLSAIDEGRAGRRWLLVAASMAMSICATLIYEPSITLYAIAPLMVLARDGVAALLKTIKARRGEIAAWLVAPTINALYFIYATYVLKSGYQTESAQQGMLTGIRHNMHYLIESLAFRMFVDAWVSVVNIFREVVHWPYLILVSLVTAAGFWIVSRGETAARNWPRIARLIVVGIIIAVLAYMPFMVAESHMVITQRTMMGPAFGVAIIFVAVVNVLLGDHRLSVIVASTVLVFAGLTAQLYQLDAYTRQYVDVIQPYMSMIGDRADHTKKTHLVFDRTGYAGHLNGMYFSNVADGPRVRFGEYQQIYILCMDAPPSPYLPSEQCKRDGKDWKITSQTGETSKAADVDVIDFGKDFDNGYHARLGQWRDLGRFNLARSMFYHRPDDADMYDCKPGSMWGYSNFCRGTGWTDGIYRKSGLRTTGFVLAVSTHADFVFRMKPAKTAYTLRMRTYGGANSDIIQAMKIDINGHPVTFRLSQPDLIEAAVDPGYLIDGTNSVTLENAIINGYPTGLAVEHVSLMPSR